MIATRQVWHAPPLPRVALFPHSGYGGSVLHNEDYVVPYFPQLIFWDFRYAHVVVAFPVASTAS
jgi:hypothetical protein